MNWVTLMAPIFPVVLYLRSRAVSGLPPTISYQPPLSLASVSYYDPTQLVSLLLPWPSFSRCWTQSSEWSFSDVSQLCHSSSRNVLRERALFCGHVYPGGSHSPLLGYTLFCGNNLHVKVRRFLSLSGQSRPSLPSCSFPHV